jgi:hypothetical protein
MGRKERDIIVDKVFYGWEAGIFNKFFNKEQIQTSKHHPLKNFKDTEQVANRRYGIFTILYNRK